VTPVGVFLGRTVPPFRARGNPRYALSDRPAVALRCRPLLEGAALAGFVALRDGGLAGLLRYWVVLYQQLLKV
jgi:hypothetical protein